MVDLDQLDVAVTRMSAFEQTIEEQLQTLDAGIARLQSLWSGAAADAQLAAHREWLAGAHRMRAGLAKMRTAATTAHRNYGSAVQANVAMWG
ncbi:MAG: WXG100 family type VII secretion target [Jatrophihabitans sp.]